MFALLDAIRTGFLQTAFIKFYSGASEERKTDVSGSTWYIAFIITFILIVPNLPVLFTFNNINDSGVLFFYNGMVLLFCLPARLMLVSGYYRRSNVLTAY